MPGTRDADPTITNPKSGAFGWQQWLGERKTELQQYAKDIGGDFNDPLVQARFFDNEMRTQRGAGKRAAEAFANARTVEDVTNAMAHFSRTDGYTADDQTKSVGYAQRLANTRAIYGRVSQIAQGTSGQTGPVPPPPGAGSDPNAPTTGAPAAPTATEETARANIRRYQALGAAAEAAGYSAAASYWYSLSKPPEGYTFTPDGRQVVIQGGPKSTSEITRTKAAEAAAHSGSLVTRIDQPETGPYPAGLGRTTIAGAGMIGGLMLGLGVFLPTGWPRISAGRAPFVPQSGTRSRSRRGGHLSAEKASRLKPPSKR